MCVCAFCEGSLSHLAAKRGQKDNHSTPHVDTKGSACAKPRDPLINAEVEYLSVSTHLGLDGHKCSYGLASDLKRTWSFGGPFSAPLRNKLNNCADISCRSSLACGEARVPMREVKA